MFAKKGCEEVRSRTNRGTVRDLKMEVDRPHTEVARRAALDLNPQSAGLQRSRAAEEDMEGGESPQQGERWLA